MGIATRMPALQSADYRFLFYNTVLAAAARWALMLARGWLVFELTDSTGAVGIVTFAGMELSDAIDPTTLIVDSIRARQIAGGCQ